MNMVNRKPEDRVCPFLSLFGDGMTYCIGDRCALFGEGGCALAELIALHKKMAKRASPSLEEVNRKMNALMGLSPEHRQLVRDLEGIGPVPPTDESGDLTPEELEEALKEPVFDEEPDISFEPQAVGEEAEERDFPAEKIKDPFEVKDISKRKRSEKIAGKGKAGGKGGRNR
jgi:hypothetical protein